MLAYLLRGVHADSLEISIGLGLITAICVASANYVINEWLDRDFDKFHPTKSGRPAVQKQLRGNIVLFEWLALLGVGLACAFATSKAMFLTAGVFALQGVVYNVPPLRTKDKAYLDVISESINNPLRLIIGWAMIDPTTFPPLFGYPDVLGGRRVSHGGEAAFGVPRDCGFAWYTTIGTI